jgi:uncharacterized protein (TIGR00369 family)
LSNDRTNFKKRTMTTRPAFIQDPDPDHPGWYSWTLSDPSRFNGQILGKMLIRQDDDGKARTRMFPEHRHTNLMDSLHGGTILSLIDVSLFSGARLYGLIEAGTAVTLDLSVQFIGGSKAGAPVDAVVELLKETKRLLFMRGVVEQDGAMLAAFSGTVRKPSVR